MQAWLNTWYSVSHSPQVNRGDQQDTQQLSQLSGSAFEIIFMKMMTGHHWQAVIPSVDLLRNGYHHALEDLAEDIITGQVSEVRQCATGFAHGTALATGSIAATKWEISDSRNTSSPRKWGCGFKNFGTSGSAATRTVETLRLNRPGASGMF